jgi:hypothetical protein
MRHAHSQRKGGEGGLIAEGSSAKWGVQTFVGLGAKNGSVTPGAGAIVDKQCGLENHPHVNPGSPAHKQIQ